MDDGKQVTVSHWPHSIIKSCPYSTVPSFLSKLCFWKPISEHCCRLDSIVLDIFQTAEMPDFYADGEYDLSGFAVGIVKKDSVIDGKNIEVGDVLIGLPSSGVHSNGFSLVRRFAFVPLRLLVF